MDELDFVILKKLDKNCRISYSDITRDLDLTVKAVSKRIDRLLEENVIKYFSVQFNYNLLGYRHYIGSIQINKAVQPENFFKELQLLPEIHEIWVLIDGSLTISFFAQNAKHLEELINKLIQHGAKIRGYTETRTHFPPDISFSPTDWRIIFFLLKNSRASKLKIANALSISEKTVMRRLNRMVNMNLVQFIPEIDFEKFSGIAAGVISVVTEGPSKSKYLKLKDDKNIKYWRNTGGVTPSIVLFVYGRNLTEIYDMYSYLKYQEDVKDCSLTFVVKNWENSNIIEDAVLEKIQ